MGREVQHLLWVSTWDHHQWGCSTPSIWSQEECSHYCCCAPYPPPPKHLVIGVCEQGSEVLPAGPVNFLVTLAPHSISTPNPLHIVGLRATDGSGHRTPPIHPSGTLLARLRVSAPSTDPSGKLFSTSNEVHSTRVDQAMFSSESGVPAPKSVTAPTRVATRKSQLQCMVLMFPASSFTSCAGTPSATWQTTTYSVSLHQSLTFHFPWYASFFISATSPSTNCAVLMVLS